MTRDEEKAAIATTITTFPAEFGLRGFPGEVFRIGERESYFGGQGNRTMMLYTQRKIGNDWCDFAKGTEKELRAEVVAL